MKILTAFILGLGIATLISTISITEFSIRRGAIASKYVPLALRANYPLWILLVLRHWWPPASIVMGVYAIIAGIIALALTAKARNAIRDRQQ